MFLDFYKVREQPFGITPDPRFLFLGRSHREALASLFCGVETERGFMALIASPGLGKTTLAFQLLEKVQRSARTIFLFQTQCNSRELFQYLLSDLGVDPTGMEVVSMHNKLNEILSRDLLAGRRFILVIDEAQNLDPSVLETIRLLSNFETPRRKLLQILLIGQPQLGRNLAEPALLQLQQRIAVFARLRPFDPEETAAYITHRLNVAGYDGPALFGSDALDIISARSQGIPRNINSLCFSALCLGCALDRKRIDAKIMKEVVSDLDGESVQEPVVEKSLPVGSNVPVKDSGVTLSYLSKSTKLFRRGLLAGAAVAAAVTIAGFTLSYTTGRWRAGAEPGSSRIPSVIAEGGSAQPSSFSNLNSSMDETNGIVSPNAATPSALNNGYSRALKFVLQCEETLRQMTRRALG